MKRYYQCDKEIFDWNIPLAAYLSKPCNICYSALKEWNYFYIYCPKCLYCLSGNIFTSLSDTVGAISIGVYFTKNHMEYRKSLFCDRERSNFYSIYRSKSIYLGQSTTLSSIEYFH